ncbi:MAG: YkgJ family cysteine cluster protein [Desulforhopalus sp.]
MMLGDREHQVDKTRQAPQKDSSFEMQCRKCGECCKNGGPALHLEDLVLITSGKLAVSDLITIRKGELVHNPVSGKIQPAAVELVKIVGSGKQWQCCYYDNEQGCTIYHYRPLGCRLLKCWDTADILGLVEKDTVGRLDIVTDNAPLIALITDHEELCPCAGLHSIMDEKGSLTQEQKKELETRVRNDLQFRKKVLEDFGFSLREELFYFGRPFFQLLQPLGVKVVESESGIQLIWDA